MLVRILPLFISLLLLPVAVLSQQTTSEEEDPFKRDPIFNKTLQELLGEKTEEDSDDIDPKRRFRSLQEEGIDFDGALEAGPYNTNPLFNQFPNLPMIHYNRVNGLFLGLKKERMQWHDYGGFFNIARFRPHGLIGYGFASNRWEYAIGLERFIGRENRVMIGAEFHRASATEDHWRVGLIESSLTAFFASYDFPIIMKKTGLVRMWLFGENDGTKRPSPTTMTIFPHLKLRQRFPSLGNEVCFVIISQLISPQTRQILRGLISPSHSIPKG